MSWEQSLFKASEWISGKPVLGVLPLLNWRRKIRGNNWPAELHEKNCVFLG
jgi:hypothetical protein